MSGVQDGRKAELERQWTKYGPGLASFLPHLEDADAEALWDALHDAVHALPARERELADLRARHASAISLIVRYTAAYYNLVAAKLPSEEMVGLQRELYDDVCEWLDHEGIKPAEGALTSMLAAEKGAQP